MGIKTMKTVKQKDVDAMKALARTNIMSAEQLKEFGITNNRIKQMAKDKYLKKLTHTDKKGKSHHVYCLGTKGEKYCNGVLGINTFYASTSIKHDLALGREYLKLSQTERESVKVELDCRREFLQMLKELNNKSQDQSRDIEERNQDEQLYKQLREQYETKQLSTVDMTYVRDDGVEIALEVVGDSYTQADKDAKVAFATAMKLEIILVKN